MINERNLTLRNVWLLSAALILVMLAISSYVWLQIPAGESVCVHWDVAGECDGYGSKFVGIFLMPIVATGMVGLFVLIPRIDPRAVHIAQSRQAYTAVWVTLLVFFLIFHSGLMFELLGHDANIGFYLPLLLGLMFVVIGSALGKVRSNYFFGIRTPWTLSSELSWSKTHQLGGKLFVGLGLLFMASALVFTGDVWIILLLGSLFALVVFLMGYSYFIWKGDPDV